MRQRKKKIGRNEKCSCGSGLKYKRCCGGASPHQSSITTIGHGELPPEVRQAFIEHQRQEAERIRNFGHGRPIIALDHLEYKFVAVGGRLYYSNKWKTFPDFLWDYITGVMTKEWSDAELKQPFEERHPIVQWYDYLCNFQRQNATEEPGEIHSAISTGYVMAYTALANDLYTLAHNALLQQKLVKRLKVKDQFQGARYETYVAAAFVRAGFEVVLEDESDSTTSHCEFSATHRATGFQYSVEAKSRHRPGFLGQTGTPSPLHEIKANVNRLLRNALKKKAQYARIIFIDVNVPPEDGKLIKTEWFKKIIDQIDALEEEKTPDGPWPPAFVFFTNHPCHYIRDEQPAPGRHTIFTAINMPEFKQSDTTVLREYPAIAQLFNSVINHTKIPNDFPD